MISNQRRKCLQSSSMKLLQADTRRGKSLLDKFLWKGKVSGIMKTGHQGRTVGVE